MPPWSYSSLTAFETCPRKFYHTKVAKTVKEPPTEHTAHGIEVHKAFEDSVNLGAPMPEKYAQWQPIALKLQQTPGEKLAELEIALDRQFRPVEWKDPDAWCRGIVDVVVEKDDAALAGDWKTGRRKPDSTQLMLFAALLMHAREHLKKVTTAFFWLKENKVDKSAYTRENLPTIWQEFMPRVKRLERAYEDDSWAPKPSGLCNGWCPVGRDKCEFWKPKK